jgi:hypothetical protein
MQMLNLGQQLQARYEQHRAEQKRKQDVFAPEYRTEKEASNLVRKLLEQEGWEYQEQVNTGTGNRIDFVVTAHCFASGREIKFGIECKRQMSDYFSHGMSATVLADYLEQAAAYSRALNLPVFLGPVQTTLSPSSTYIGGLELSSLSALNIFGGRLNVGTLVFGRHKYMILRGDTFWDQGSGFNQKRLNMVTSTGSKKQRTSL